MLNKNYQPAFIAMPMEFVQAPRAPLLWKIPVGAIVLDPKWPQKQPGAVTEMGFFQEFGPLGLECCSSGRMPKLSSTQSNMKWGEIPREQAKVQEHHIK